MRAAGHAVLLLCFAVSPAVELPAQVHYEAQPRPIVTATNERWYQAGEPITFEGHFYYPSGSQVYFNPNTMVRTGAYRGVPLYADATIEPYSIILVPLTGGLMQPYERRRVGDLAGSTGSRAPSFPVAIAAESAARTALPQAAAPPVVGPGITVDRDPTGPEAASVLPPGGRAPGEPGVAGTAGAAPPPPPRRQLIQEGAKPRGLNEVFVNYQGRRWRSAGAAVELTSEFEVIGQYHGYRVYTRRGAVDRRPRIYLPSREGLVAPYEQAGKAIAY